MRQIILHIYIAQTESSMRPQSLNDLFALFFDPRVPVLFVVGSIVLAIVGNGTYDLLLRWLGDTPQTIVAVIVGAILILVFVLLGFQALLRARHRALGTQLSQDEIANPHAGLVLFVSAGELEQGSEKHAIDHHLQENQLRHCWLIETPESAQKSLLLKGYLEDRNVRTHPIPIQHGYQARLAYDAIRQALQEAQQIAEALPVIVDITAGARPVAAGAVLACRDQQVPMEYVLGTYINGKLDKRVPPKIMKVELQER